MAAGSLVGAGYDCEQPIVVSSPDAETWDVTVVDTRADLFAPSIHVASGRFFALGYGHYARGGGAMVWTSSDGRSWSRLESPSFRDRSVGDIIESPDGTFAIGHEAPIDSDNTSGFLLWPVHADGTFGKARVVDMGREGNLVTGAIWTGEEFLAWAWPRWTIGETTVLRSVDGITWTIRSSITSPAESYVADMAAIGDRIIAVGYSGRTFPLTPRAWVSEDSARSWSVASVEGHDARMEGVDAAGGGFVARGAAPSLNGDVASWSSVDGVAWTRLADDVDRPAIPGFSASVPVSIGDLVCVAGTFEDGTVPRAAIYCILRA
jgi:hypothetical protein